MSFVNELKKMNRKELDNIVFSIALTERQTKIFYARYLSGYSLLNIADLICVSYSTVTHESVIINNKIDKHMNSI